ncbi:MAG: radical SAM protein [Methylibium sp.]|nr:radical SAM protein [Methylibium sp.]
MRCDDGRRRRLHLAQKAFASHDAQEVCVTDHAIALPTTRAARAIHATPASFALGIGLTNECNLACAFCYRDPDRLDRLTLDQVREVMASVPVRSVNLGTGENGMHPDFRQMLAFLAAQPIKLTMTSNGHSVAMLDDEELKAFHDVELSLDYPNEAEQDGQRGAGNWALLHRQAERLVRLGVSVTFIAVMMRSNFSRLAEIAALVARYGAPLRLNVYQSVRSDAYALTYEEYWDGFERLFAETDVIAIGEPLVRAMAGLPPRTGGCGLGTIRVTPRGRVQPCVYWPGPGDSLDALVEQGAGIVESEAFAAARSLPEACRSCTFREPCRGGCAGRRRLHGALDKPDLYCPIVRGQTRRLAIRMAPGRDLPKLDSACTTIVMARS